MTNTTVNKISHSQVSRFASCPKSYEFWYKKRYRPTTQSAALLFGTAIDLALSAMLKALKEPEGAKKPEDSFAYFWRFQEINGEKTYLTTCTKIVYANSDYQADLLEPEDVVKIKEEIEKMYPDSITSDWYAHPLAFIDQIFEEKKAVGYDMLPEDRKRVLNTANWYCMYRKGLAMIQTLRNDIIPNITEVLGSQEYVSLENEEGDKIIGYADLVCRWKDIKEPIIFDLKTSSIEYEEDSVLTSPQLALYVHGLSDKFEKTRKAGYIVLNKHIKMNKTKVCSVCGFDGSGARHKTCANEIEGKRCGGEWIVKCNPSAYVQIIINDIPEQTEDIVLENYDYINRAIKTGDFHRNFGNCKRFFGRCEFWNLCFEGKMDGLMTQELKKK